MSKTDVLVKLRELHEELAALKSLADSGQKIDESTIELLGQLITDAGEMLDYQKQRGILDPASDDVRSSEGGALEQEDELSSELPHDSDSLLERVHQLQSEHPLVARFINQVTDLLNSIGV